MAAADGSPVTPEELKEASKIASQALIAFQEAAKDNEATKQNAQKALEKFEDLNSKFVKSLAEHQNAIKDADEKVKAIEAKASAAERLTEEQKKRIDDLIVQIATRGTQTKTAAEAQREAPEFKNFFAWLAFHPKKGVAWDDIDLKTLRTDSETAGAYLIPQIMDNEIRKNITEISPVRAYARTRTAPGKTMDIPRRLALPRAYYEGEAEEDELGESTYGSEQITLYRQSITVPATLDMMVSSAFDLEREISADVGEAFGVGEGVNFVLGSGNKGPQGFMVDTRIEVVDTGTTGEVDFLDMATIAGKLKRGQAPMWFMNRRTLAKMWQIKSSIGVPIWAPVAGSSPATIWGYPYSSDMIDLADAQTGAGAKPIIFADMRRLYEIYDMIGISVIRDDLTKKRQAITEWTFRRYNTGRVIMPEAAKIMRIKS